MRWRLNARVLRVGVVGLSWLVCGTTVAQHHVEIDRASDEKPSKVPACTARAMDVRVLPVVESQTVHGLHGLPIEYTNLGTAACSLPMGWYLTLYPKVEVSYDGEFDGEYWEDQRHILKPGETMHLVAVWTSVPDRAGSCPPFDGFTLTLGEQPLLTVRHLSMQTCVMKDSPLMDGRYISGEALPKGWPVEEDGLIEEDEVTKPLRFAYDLPFSGAVKLEAMVPAPVLKQERVMLRLDFPVPLAEGCPYVMLRTRLANGRTTVDFNHCEAAETAKKDSALLNLDRLGLPLQMGAMQFDAISRIRVDGAEVYAASNSVMMHVMNEQTPGLPKIEGALRACTMGDLEVNAKVVSMEDGIRRAQVYEVKNTSATGCDVGGVPEVHSMGMGTWETRTPDGRPPGTQTEMADMGPVCGNCDDPLFAARPNGWIDLKPGDSGHFIVGYGTLGIKEIEDGAVLGTAVTRVEWKLGGETMYLPLKGLVDQPLDVSSWREGAYDGDPKNERWRAKLEPVVGELPEDCAKSMMKMRDEKAKGHSVFFAPRDGVAIGISLDGVEIEPNSGLIPMGEDLNLTLWVDNRTGKKRLVGGCGNSDSLIPEMAVWDIYGHRVVDPKEAEEPEIALSLCTLMSGFLAEPHSCSSTQMSEYVGSAKMLPAGRYVVGEAQRIVRGKYLKKHEMPTDGLAFTVLNLPREQSLDKDPNQ